ncbi:polymeric immunoglobulin receptor-like [Alosa pseudoharengus]|uniref:polymeric immunoglobulin receptor-like n=1 Tax=Alosa pseudoharengus TaxID=34774 RepID=UPI003F89AC74
MNTPLLILTLTLHLISGDCRAPNFGSPGNTLNVSCHYAAKYANMQKHFCKVMEDGQCSMRVSSRENISDTTQNHSRFSLTDYPQQMNFTVRLSHLRAEDTGVYLCGAQNPEPPFNRVLVGDETHIIVNPVIGHKGDEAKLRCPYEVGHQTYLKYLSRGECASTGYVLIKTELRRQARASQGRFSLQDEREGRVFSVTISNLTAEDSGKYCCGIETLDNDVLIELLLTVALASTSPSHTSGPYTSRPSLHSLPAITAEYLAGSAVVMSVLRVVVMLLFALGVAVFFRCRRTQPPQVLRVTQVPEDSSQNHADPIYQELD